MSGLPCTVIPAGSIPQGIAALLAFNPDLTAEANAVAMTEAASVILSGEIAIAVRDATVDGRRVLQGQAIALLDGKLVAATTEPSLALVQLCREIEIADGALITIYWGENVEEASALAAKEAIKHERPDVEIELVSGGQPHYHYLVSIE